MLTNEQRAEIRERYLKVDTSNVADALDELNLKDQGLSSNFTPFPSETGPMAGFAYTIQGQMTPYEGGGDPEKMKACAELQPNDISVWSGDGDGICYFGELIAIGMKEKGCRGALVNGGIRDIKWLKAINFPVYARYRTPVQSIMRWKVNAWNTPVSLPGATSKNVTVSPGDFILADDDGAIVIPQSHLVEVLERAEQLTQTEVMVRAELKQGLTLETALAKYGHV